MNRLGQRILRRIRNTRTPGPRWLVARYLSWRWGARVSRHAEIQYPFRLRLAKGCRLGACEVICTGDITLDEEVEVRNGAILDAQGGPIRLGRRTTVNPYCILYGAGGLEIGSEVAIAAHTVMIPANHSIDDLDRPIRDQPVRQVGIRIGDNVWIASNCVILDGVEIGNGAVVAAGAVVNRSVASDDVVAGVPARRLRNRRDKHR